MSPVEVRSAESAPLDVVRKEEKAVSDEIQFKYFYGTESEMLTFYRIPKLLVTSKYFKTLTNDAKIIEEYGDESLLSEYRCELFNKRGIFSPSAGRAEKDIAEDYKDNADFLSIKYPKTADVFFKMSQRYIYDSDLERRRAENGYF